MSTLQTQRDTSLPTLKHVRYMLLPNYTKEVPLSPPPPFWPFSFEGLFVSAVSVTPCGTRSTAASLHSSSWLSLDGQTQ